MLTNFVTKNKQNSNFSNLSNNGNEDLGFEFKLKKSCSHINSPSFDNPQPSRDNNGEFDVNEVKFSNVEIEENDLLSQSARSRRRGCGIKCRIF